MRTRPRQRTIRTAAIVATILGMAVWAPRTAAAESQRGLKWQFSFPITFASGTTVDGQEGTNFKLNDDVGWGLAFGYHMNENLMLGADFTWISANYNAHVAFDTNSDGKPDGTADVSGTLEAATVHFVGQYNILKKNITPFVRASLGWTWLDSNIPSAPPQGSCWWDPWYGYICNTWQPTYGATDFSYGAAAGLRADIQERFFVELSYNVLWIDTSKAGTPNIDGVRVNLGWKY